MQNSFTLKCMISYKHRFHGHNGLRQVYEKGFTTRSSAIGMKALINSKRKNYRVAVVVSKKVSKSAVKRNRIRRRLYELVRTNQNDIAKPYDLVLSVYNDSVAEMPTEQLNNLVKKILTDGRVI